MRTGLLALTLSLALIPSPPRAATKLRMDDKANLWPRAERVAKMDFTDRMGRAMTQLSPDLTNAYFLRCLEETANIGDTKDLTLGDLVRTCISMQVGQSPE